MGADQNCDEDKITTTNSRSIKVHRSICSSLIKVVERISTILPQIEETRPGSSSGIQSLCSLKNELDKANSLFNYCSDSSKLYLALTGDVILQRFTRIRNLLNQSLNQIQYIVPVQLATEISVIISDLKRVRIVLNLCEEEAGKTVKEFLKKGLISSSESDVKEAIDVMRFAASRLSIVSEKELMIEKRSIRKLIDKVSADQSTKMNILVYLLNLLKDHGQTIVTDLTDNYVPNDDSNENFSFTQEYGSFNVDSSLSCTSLASLRGCFNNLALVPGDMSSVSLNDNYSNHFHPETVDESKNNLLVENLDSLPWELQCSAVEDLEKQMQHNRSTDDIVDPLIKFVKDAFGFQDSRALKIGCRLLSTCFKTFKRSSSNFQAYELLASLLDSGATEEALSIVESLSCHEDCKYTIASSTVFSSVLKLLVESDSRQIQKSAILILKNLSSNKDTHSFIDSSNLIPTLNRLFEGDMDLAANIITVYDNFFQTEEGFTAVVAETDGFISQIAKLLEFESSEVQEHAVSVLHTLCKRKGQSCQLAKNEDIIPSLVIISANSNERVKEMAMVVLQGFQDDAEVQVVHEEQPQPQQHIERSCEKQFIEKKSSCKRTVLGMRIPLFSKRPSSLARK
ncbi:U-box domain-containing protein 45-like [Impatiens glandulifera]|uniref:U-box domain-containing protein 45-like n=1 Tax=Impatiens glandulifera TaxID=253017 RepID=UPI001FB0971B|nr:U-box domain-containing protein 45-like [Impatiens glandulifera]